MTARVVAAVLRAAAIFPFVIVHIGCPHAGDRFEQTALDEFISKYWGPEVFADECTGLRFDSKAPLVVHSESPGFAVTLLDFAAVAPIDVKGAAEEQGGLETLARSGTSEGFTNPVDLSAYPFAKPSDSARPKDEWQPSDGYLLRFSNRVHFQERIYLQLWVKASRTSSGTRIDYVFDEAGRLLASRKQSRRCDDWG